MPKPDLGVKRTCPETGKKFYDLNKDPIVSPFTGTEYPVSYFEEVVAKTSKKRAKPQPEEDEAEEKPDAKAAEGDDDEDEDEDDAPELDEEPIDLGDDEEDEDEDDTPKPKRKAAAPDEELEGFSDEEADLDDDDDDDTGVLLDDDDDDALGDDLAVDDDDDD